MKRIIYATCLTLLATFAYSESPSLTLIPVNIDPLGAEQPVPWTVHADVLNVRDHPSSENSTIIGSLKYEDQVFGDFYLIEETDEEWLRIQYKNREAWITITRLTRPHPKNLAALEIHQNLPFGEEIVNRWWGIPLDYEPNDLVEIHEPYILSGSERVYKLRKEAAAAARELLDAARADGIEMFIRSPYRSGSIQHTIYLRNVEKAGMNQRFSAPPGHSEHQLATTIDFGIASGRFLKATDPEYRWIHENGPKFGYRQTYTADNVDKTGYIEEPWHWRYMGKSE